MSQDVWPTFIGEGFPIREPIHDTIVQASSSGQDEVRIGKYPYPRYRWTFPYQYLGDAFPQTANTDYRKFIAFFKAHSGRFDSFLLTVPGDNAVTGEIIGTGDGTTKTFQCMRTLDDFQEPVYGVQSSSLVVKINGTATGAYSLSPSALITFSSAPGGGAVISVNMPVYYWRVRFDSDNIQFQQLMNGIWSLKQIVMMSTRQ